MNEKNLKTQLHEIAEFKIPDTTNIWPKMQIKHNSPIAKDRFRLKPNLLKPALIVLTLIFAIVMIPTVNANLEDFLETIGGAIFNITDDYPGGDNVTIVPSEEIAVEQILAQYPFEMPTYMPHGYELQSNARVTAFHEFETRPSIQLTWDDSIAGTGHIFLHISPPGTGGEPVGPDSLEMIVIEGQEVALIMGGWYQNTNEWNYDLGYRFKWEKDDLLYSLSFWDIELMDEMTHTVASMIGSGD